MTKILTMFALSVAVTTPAFAQDEAPRSKTVRYADLDLSTTAGRAALDRRIQAAARSVCEPLESYVLEVQMAGRRCYRSTIASARQAATLAALKRDSSVRVAVR